jgi:very-short-patch-repair endonuclease
VVEILKEELEANPEHEVGVTAMSVAQLVEIRARIEAEAQDNSLLQQWLDEGGRARNLETIQGDEFDVSILSFGYGKDAAGNLQLNFGPLSRDDGYKRLNVATTRARKKTIVVASLCASDIPANRVGPGGQLVRQYLDYAERGPITLAGAVRAGGIDVYESPFEEEVARELRALGWLVDTQVGVGKFRVDIGVKHPNHPGLYLAGVECDGATYHSAETARDRDIGRQEVLKRLGWNIYRIWSPDWFRDRRRVLADLQSYLYELLADDGSQDSDSTYDDGRRGWQTPLRRNQPPVFRPLEQGMRPGTVPYGVEGPTSFPVGYDSSQWKQWLVEKIRVEGPWEENELIGMISLHSGPTLYQLRSLVRVAVSEGKLVAKEGRLWHPETDPRLVPVKVNSGAARRDFVLYSNPELLRSLELACLEVGSAPSSELPTLAARLLGFPRTTQAVRERLESLMARAVSTGYLTKDGDSYRVSNPLGSGLRLLGQQPFPSDRLPDRQLQKGIPEAPTAQDIRPQRSKSRASQAADTPDLSLFLKAAESRKPLRIRYRSGSGQVTNRTVDVYGVGVNYFDAFDHLRGEQRTFRIDRVIKAEWTSANPFAPPRHYSPSSWVMRERRA